MPTAPHLVRWNKQYAKNGLKIVAVSDGRRSRVGNVKTQMKEDEVDYPVLFDCGGRMPKELGVRKYPMAFLVGRDGKVAWEGVLGGKKRWKELPKLLERELRRKEKPPGR